MLRLLYRLTHPGEARRVYYLDHAHETRSGDRRALAVATFDDWPRR